MKAEFLSRRYIGPRCSSAQAVAPDHLWPNHGRLDGG